MADNKQEIIDFGFHVDTADSAKAFKDLERQASRHYKRIEKEQGKLDTGMGKMLNSVFKAKKAWKPMLTQVEKAYKKLNDQANSYADTLAGLRQDEKKASGDELNVIKQKIKEVQKLHTEKKEAAKTFETFKGDFETKFKFDISGWGAIAKDAGQDLARPLNSLLSKDLPGAISDSGDLLGRSIESSFETVGGKFSKWGESWGKKAKAKIKEHQDKKGSAAGMGAAGAGMKVAAGGAKGMGGMLKILAKIGPALTLVSTAVAALVKLFIDAEGAAKDLNKEVLATAGTAQFLHGQTKGAAGGAKELGKTLTDIQNAAFAFSNIEWGIDAGKHKEVLGMLTNEGVSLKRMREDMEKTAAATGDMAGYVKSWGNLTQMSVAYSRALGVSTSELGMMQSEMMTDLGMSLTSVQTSFQQITRVSEDSGIASNKFFGIIRGVSQDLSLYNTRMSDAVALLGELGKVMSPKNAQQFLQASMGVLKNMGRTEKLKVAMLAGGGQKGAKAVTERDIASKTRSLAEEVNLASGGKGDQKAIEAAITAGGPAFSKMLDGLGINKEQRGAMRGAAIDIEKRNIQMKAGKFGQGLAAGGGGPAAQLTIMKSALLSMSGHTSLLSASGSLSTEMMAEQLGVSEEMMDSFIKFESAMNDQRETLKQGLDDEKVRQKLTEAGIQLTGDAEEDAAAIMKAGDDQIMASLDKATQEELKKSAEQIDYQKQTAGNVSSMTDKLEQLVQFMMNEFYQAIMGMWETIASAPIFGSKSGREKLAVGTSGNQELIKAFGKGGRRGAKQAVLDKVRAAKEEAAQIKKDTDPANAEGNAARLKELAPLLAIDQKKGSMLGKKRDTGVNSLSGVGSGKALEMNSSEFISQIGPLLSIATKGAPGSSGTAPTPTPGTAPVPGKETVVEPTPVADTGGASAEKQDETTKATTKVVKAIQKSPIANKSKYESSTSRAMLDSMRTALFEFALYKDMDKGVLAQAAKTAGGGVNVSRAVGDTATKKGTIAEGAIAGLTQAKAHAAGGIVTSIVGGMAQTMRLPPGEGMASVAPGERIVPGGKGGSGSQKVVLELKGDLARFVQAKVVDGVADFERSKRKR